MDLFYIIISIAIVIASYGIIATLKNGFSEMVKGMEAMNEKIARLEEEVRSKK